MRNNLNIDEYKMEYFNSKGSKFEFSKNEPCFIPNVPLKFLTKSILISDHIETERQITIVTHLLQEQNGIDETLIWYSRTFVIDFTPSPDQIYYELTKGEECLIEKAMNNQELHNYFVKRKFKSFEELEQPLIKKIRSQFIWNVGIAGNIVSYLYSE